MIDKFLDKRFFLAGLLGLALLAFSPSLVRAQDLSVLQNMRCFFNPVTIPFFSTPSYCPKTPLPTPALEVNPSQPSLVSGGNQVPPVKEDTGGLTSPPIVIYSSSPAVVPAKALASAGASSGGGLTTSQIESIIRDYLNSNPSIVSKLQGPPGPVGLPGPEGPPGPAGNSGMYVGQPAANVAPAAPAVNPVVFMPVGVTYADPAHNFSGGTYASIANFNSNLLTANTTNITTLNVSGSSTLSGGLSVTGAIASSGALSGTGLTLSGLLSFTGTDHAGIKLNNLTTAERDALTPAAGMTIFNTTVSKMQVYNGTTWKNVGNPEIGAEVTSGTSGSVLYVDSSGNLGQDNANFFYDATNHRLGLGTITPAKTLDITGTANVTGAATFGSTLAATGHTTFEGVTSTGATGTGKLVYDTSPTLTTPALGTPSALVGTNITGTAAGLTAGNVTTDANLTGPITSVGNATSIASQTGTGTTFVMQTSPTLTTPTLGVASATSVASPLFTNATALSVSTTAGNITLQPAGTGTTGSVVIGAAAGGAGSATPDILVLDKTSGSNPTGVEGGMIIDSTGKFNIYEGGAWKILCNKTDQTCGTGSGSALSAITAATTGNTIASGNNAQVWNWALTSDSKTAFSFGETTAATGGTADNQAIVGINTLATSTAIPLYIKNYGATDSLRVDDTSGDTTPFVIDASGNVGIGTTSPNALLHVNGFIQSGIASSVEGRLSLYGVSGSNEFRIGTNGATSYLSASGAPLKLTTTSGEIRLETNGSVLINSDVDNGSGNKLQVTGNSNFTGNVGIGTTSPGALLDVGLAGTTLGVVRLAGSTSGNVSLQPNAVAGTGIVLTLPATTGTLITTGDSGTVTGTMIQSGVALAGNPTTTTQASTDNSTRIATTAFVANAVLGQNYKEAVKYASTAALPAVLYANGSSGVGATLTGVSVGALSVDGSTPSVSDRVLIKNQVSTLQNGVYTVTVVGSGAAVFVLTRATDFDESTDLKTGDSVFVTSGTANSATTWAYGGADSPTIGTDAITFTQVAGQGSFTSGNGITITGTSVAIDTSITVDKTTAQTLTNKTLTSPIIANIAPGADFTITQNSVTPFVSVNSGAVANTLYLSGGKVGVGTTADSVAELNISGSTTASGTTAVAGTLANLTLTNSTSSGSQFGSRLINTVNGTVAGTEEGLLLRVTDSTALANTTRGLEVQSWNGTNTAGTNTAIAAFGKTFGVSATIDALAGGVSQPAAVFAYLDNSTATTAGNAIRAYTDQATSANLVSFYQETSAFTGTGLIMNFGNNAGSFSGNFVDLQKGGTSYAHVTSTGATFVSLPGTQNTVALCHATNGQSNNDQIVDCSGAPSDVAEWYDTAPDVGLGDVVATSTDTTQFNYSSGLGTVTDAQGNKYEQVPLPGGNVNLSVLKKADDQSAILGIVSTAPYQTFGEDVLKNAKHPERIALAGRVPVNVSEENGAIKAGDRLTVSKNLPGYAMKMTESGQSIGIALADSSGATGQILVFVNLGYQLKLDDFTAPSPEAGSFADQFFTSLFAKINAWLADVGNGISSVYANVFNAKEKICVDGECLTKDDIHNLLLLAHPPVDPHALTNQPTTVASPTPPPASSPSPDSSGHASDSSAPAQDSLPADNSSTPPPDNPATPPPTTDSKPVSDSAPVTDSPSLPPTPDSTSTADSASVTSALPASSLAPVGGVGTPTSDNNQNAGTNPPPTSSPAPAPAPASTP